jgi:hypothetical protein
MFDGWNTDRVHRFRAEAASRGLAAADVEAWIRSLLPGTFCTADGDGPPVVTTGGHPALPEDLPVPQYPLVATVDCALLSPDPTGLPLPTGGHLLFFADPDLGLRGLRDDAVLHVPAGTPTTERRAEPAYGPFPTQELRRRWQHLSPADTDVFTEARYGDDADDEQYETAQELESAWTEVGGSWPTWTFALGGHPIALNDDPLFVAGKEDPLLTWNSGDQAAADPCAPGIGPAFLSRSVAR